ncbi:putative U3 small nucleolar RNA-associatedprotein 11 [Monoraphidium neglectum]|uniref:U3 small nucleolar RNA-associated protein 11 n=1 Tax=Monoraphidium neglectum TaxID=145388 RepID=A0A0D2MKF8_9CHLO|nr:putative U3 small nucleolar RNA-associatedprotein 11 [Monoraphidium neglectum]KIZ01067.1 putative U3 small nucleolar RNA-associatedprotein 11 [Monoraphidium neglectum]|eukprot:XP_013900086.1 putative U3 small nucleolar RNA-associatedprotein 11 [Monoraphidium neglectum]
MGGGSLANAIKRKTHKERGQPAARSKFGLLEKKKDYKERARDFHRKEKAIKALQRKAEERNPDEFYFAMESARTKDGVHVTPTAEANKYSQSELALMKTQDVAYLRAKATAEAKSKHKVFLDSGKEAREFDPEEFFDCPRELLDRSYNRPRRAQLESAAAVSEPDTKAAAKMERRKHAAYKELAQRVERHASLDKLAQKMDAEKAVMTGRGRKRKLSSATADAPAVFRWKRERKR